MKNLRAGLFVAALVCLICMFTSHDALAQDDGPVPHRCLRVVQGNSNMPHCNTYSQRGDPIAPKYIALAQDHSPAVQFNDTFARITPTINGETQKRDALFEYDFKKYALIQS
jgi:hypothetical protein